MGYAVVIGSCFVCGRMFGFNPVRVPSHNGEPICKGCIDEINRRKVERGMLPFQVPEDAYEPVEEGEL